MRTNINFYGMSMKTIVCNNLMLQTTEVVGESSFVDDAMTMKQIN